MSNLDRSRKLFVRSILAGTSTLATLMGAQSLALIDNQAFADDSEDTVIELTAIPTLMSFPTTEPVLENSIPTATADPVLLKVEPSITIFRQSGAVNDTTLTTVDPQPQELTVLSNSSPQMIAPPNPVELQTPDPIIIVEDPVIIQQPVQQVQQPQAQQPQEQPTAEKKDKSKKSKSGSSK